MSTPTTTSQRRHAARRSGGTVALVGVLAGCFGLACVSAGSAGAAAPISQARGQFLSGTIGGRDLSTLVSIAGVQAENFGGSPVVRSNTLQASVLNAINLPLTEALQLPGGNVVSLGAVGQFSRANPDGSASAASGAIGDSGGVGVGSAPGGMPANATIRLAGPAGSALGSMALGVGSVTASAIQQARATGGQTGSYGIAGLTLDLSSPALAAAARQPIAAITAGANGLQQQFGTAVPGVTVAGLAQLPSASGLTAFSTAGGAVTADLAIGSVHIDVAALLANQGLDLNRLPANTHLMPYLTRALGTLAPEAVQSVLGAVRTRFTTALTGLTFSKPGSPLSTVELQALDAVSQQAATALSAALGQGAADLSPNGFQPLADALSAALDIIVNGRSSSNGTFTEQAVEVNLGQGTSGAQLVLASASVGQSGAPPVAAPAAPATTTPMPAVQPGRSAIKIDAGRADTRPRRSIAQTPAGATLTGFALLVIGAATWRLTVLRRRG